MVENKQGCENKVANALSRRSDFGFEDFAVSNTFVVSPCLCLISFPSPSCLCLISFPFQVLGFHLVHDSPLGGHSSFLKSFHRLKQDSFWVGMKSDLELHIRECGVCQQMKHETCKPAGLLQPLPIPYKPWTTVSMDFVNDLPLSQRLDIVMVIVDRLTKYVYFIGLSHPYFVAKVAALFAQNVFKLHGMPTSIISNRDPVFTANFWAELFKFQEVKLAMSSAYHPQTDGQTEMVNKCIEQYLRSFCTDRPTEWSNWLYLAEYSFNTNYHSATKVTP